MQDYYKEFALDGNDGVITVGDHNYVVPPVDENTKLYTCSFPWFMKRLREGKLDQEKK